MATAPRWQVPVWQKSPVTQSASAVQLVLHALAEQTKSPPHACAAGATQLPLLQVLGPTRPVPEQIGPPPQASVP